MIRRQIRNCFLVLWVSLACIVPAPAQPTAADPLKELNDSLLPVGTKDASDTLFPALIAMTPPPGAPSGLRAVSLMTSKSPAWPEWDAWAAAEPQQAALAALKTITDPKSKYTIALKFGRDAVSPEWAAASIAIDLGDPPLIALAPARLHYLDRLDRLSLLCTVEAERLATANKPEECAALLVNWLRFARIVADRPFAKEKIWAFTLAETAIERLADIACTHATLFTEKTVQDTTKELDIRALTPERIRFPIGERLALTQLIQLTIEERGGPRPESFGPTLGRLTADPANAYDLFPQAAWWSEIAKSHGGWFDTRETAEKVLNDWRKRWELNNIFDLYMRTQPDYARMDRLKFAMIEQVVKDIPNLFNLRTSTVTQLRGVRSALAVVGYHATQGQWPPALNAVQPRYVQRLDDDPWFFESEREVRDIFRYFVPIRDQPLKPRELPKPHVIRIDLSAAAADASTAGPAAGGSLSELDRLQIARLKDIAVGVYDMTTQTIDDAKLKERWTEAAKEEMRKTFSDKELLEAFQKGVQLITGLSPEQLISTVKSTLESPALKAALEAQGRAYGLSTDDMKQMTVAGIELLFVTDAFKAITKAIEDGDTLTLDMMENFGTASVEIMTGPRLYDNYVKKMVSHLANPMAESLGPSITASLTDSDFVIYSVGPDMKAEYARNVGRAGPDILVWPPVLTLERRAASSN